MNSKKINQNNAFAVFSSMVKNNRESIDLFTLIYDFFIKYF